tara:strand:- start:51 stop:446 length:396 start_codon:yes stop_codon:yes gene_type:complete
MAKKVTRSKLVKKLDSIFSQYIRQRDSEDGLCTCVTCGVQKPIKQMQNGHFITRGKYATRWDEENCGSQCVGCNMFKQGEQFKFSRYIDEKHYEGKAEEILLKSNQTVKFTDNDITEMINHYKNKLNEFDK